MSIEASGKERHVEMEAARLRVLLIEDDEDDYVLVRSMLSEVGAARFELDWVDNYDDALQIIRQGQHEVYLLDYRLGWRNGLELLKAAVAGGCRAPIILLTGQGDYEIDLEAMRVGAADYLVKDQISAPLLDRSIRYSVERKHTEEKLRRSHEELEHKIRERTADLAKTNRELQNRIAEGEQTMRALKESARLNTLLLDSLPHPAMLIRRNQVILAANRIAQEYGARVGGHCWREFGQCLHIPPEHKCYIEEHAGQVPPDGTHCSFCLANRAFGQNKPVCAPDVEAFGRLWSCWWIPIDSEIYLHYALDITDTRLAELELKQHRDHLESLVQDRTAELLRANVLLQQEIIQHKRTQEALLESENQLRFLSSRLLTAQEEERRSIARELHDGIGSSLTAIKFSLEHTLARTEAAPTLMESLTCLIAMTQRTIDESRRMMTDLRPSMLDDLGLVVTIGWFCKQYQSIYSSIRVEAACDIEENRIPEPLKIVIFRILQEALHNAAKYSGADQVNLHLTGRDGVLDLSIQDNGQGFDVRTAFGKVRSDGGFGLTSMKERAELSGGSFKIESAVGQGTKIRATWAFGS